MFVFFICQYICCFSKIFFTGTTCWNDRSPTGPAKLHRGQLSSGWVTVSSSVFSNDSNLGAMITHNNAQQFITIEARTKVMLPSLLRTGSARPPWSSTRCWRFRGVRPPSSSCCSSSTSSPSTTSRPSCSSTMGCTCNRQTLSTATASGRWSVWKSCACVNLYFLRWYCCAMQPSTVQPRWSTMSRQQIYYVLWIIKRAGLWRHHPQSGRLWKGAGTQVLFQRWEAESGQDRDRAAQRADHPHQAVQRWVGVADGSAGGGVHGGADRLRVQEVRKSSRGQGWEGLRPAEQVGQLGQGGDSTSFPSQHLHSWLCIVEERIVNKQIIGCSFYCSALMKWLSASPYVGKSLKALKTFLIGFTTYSDT